MPKKPHTHAYRLLLVAPNSPMPPFPLWDWTGTCDPNVAVSQVVTALREAADALELGETAGRN